MKTSRRIDDLGRVVIPKEIRHKMFIGIGDELIIDYDEEMNILKIYPAMPVKVENITEQLSEIYTYGTKTEREQIEEAIEKFRKRYIPEWTVEEILRREG